MRNFLFLIFFVSLFFLLPGKMNFIVQTEKQIIVNIKPKFKNYEKYFPLFIMHRNKYAPKPYAKKITYLILKYSKKYDVDPIVVLAVMSAESEFYAKAYSPSRARGLMQIVSTVWIYNEKNKYNLIDAGIVKGSWKELYDLETSIAAGTYILSVYDKFFCTKWNRQGRLKARNYNIIPECTVKRYNGQSGNAYYEKVMASLGDYYLFVESLNRTVVNNF